MKYLLLVPLAIVLATLTFLIFFELDGLGSGIAVLAAGAFFAISLKMVIAIFKPKQNK